MLRLQYWYFSVQNSTKSSAQIRTVLCRCQKSRSFLCSQLQIHWLMWYKTVLSCSIFIILPTTFFLFCFFHKTVPLPLAVLFGLIASEKNNILPAVHALEKDTGISFFSFNYQLAPSAILSRSFYFYLMVYLSPFFAELALGTWSIDKSGYYFVRVLTFAKKTMMVSCRVTQTQRCRPHDG